MLAKPDTDPLYGHRVVMMLTAESLDSKEFRVFEWSQHYTDDGESGVRVALIQVDIKEYPIYFRDEFSPVAVNLNRIEIGRQVKVKSTWSYYMGAEKTAADLAILDSPEFIRDSILSSSQSDKLTPSMNQIVRNSPSLEGSVLSQRRVVVALISNLLWILGWLALIFEGILAFFRGQRHEARRHKDLCFVCNYQLTRDMEQCPECGDEIEWRAYAMKRT